MEIGDRIDNYVVTEVLGGGMSEVYRVSDGSSRYVLKRIKEDATEDEIKLFRREIRILKGFHHPNIIEIVTDTADTPRPYYVMQNCGKSFVDLALAKTTEIELLNNVISFCEAISYAHRLGVFHRDIKPQNILIYKGIVKVADFGLSRFINRDTTTITQTGMQAGTPGFMPPEYSYGKFKEGTVAGDIYMIGKTLYYVFSHGMDVSNVRANNVPTRIFGIIDKCTRDNPAQRYSSVNAVLNELNEYRDLLLTAEQTPKTIKEIKKTYSSDIPQFKEEVFKTLSSLGSKSMEWGDVLRQLNVSELSRVIAYKRDSVIALSLHFIECLEKPTDYVQFDDIDEFAKFIKILFDFNDDEAVKQNLVSFLLNMSLDYHRWDAMKIVASILNEQMDKDVSHYKIYVMLKRKELRKICEELGSDSIFNEQIRALLKRV